MSGTLFGLAETLTELPQLYLTLGNVTFYDQEVPSSLTAGGEQMISPHKYPGGSRTLDTFGPDDDDIQWSGRFLDLLAERRCQELDTIRRAGEEVLLTWSGFRYRVVVHTFKWTYERSWQIQYQIGLMVVQDLNNPPLEEDVNDPAEQIALDAAAAALNAAQLALTAYNAILGAAL